MIRQRPALRYTLPGVGRVSRHGPLGRRRDLLIFQPQLQLVEGLGGSAEPMALHPGQLVLQLLDQKVAALQLGLDVRQPHRALPARRGVSRSRRTGTSWRRV